MNVLEVGEEYDGGGLYGFVGIGMDFLEFWFCVGWGFFLWIGDDKLVVKVIKCICINDWFKIVDFVVVIIN